MLVELPNEWFNQPHTGVGQEQPQGRLDALEDNVRFRNEWIGKELKKLQLAVIENRKDINLLLKAFRVKKRKQQVGRNMARKSKSKR